MDISILNIFFCCVYFYTFIFVLDGCIFNFSSYLIERITRVWCIHTVSVEPSEANLHINSACEFVVLDSCICAVLWNRIFV